MPDPIIKQKLTAGDLWPDEYRCTDGCGAVTEWPDSRCDACRALDEDWEWLYDDDD